MEVNENIERNTSDNYSKEAEYAADIVPLMKQLEEACERIGLPYLIHVVFKEDEESIGCGTLMSVCGKSGTAANRLALLGAMAANEFNGEALVKAAIAAGLASGILKRGEVLK